MSKSIENTGQCLCGAVKIHAKSMSNDVGACHCEMCRKWAGAPYLGVDCKDSVKFDGTENIKIFNSSEWAERGFCSECSTHLFYHLKKNDQFIVPIGLFDNQMELNFDHEIFIDSKPDYYSFKNETHKMTGAEVFAMFSEE
ncbi:Glutathione-dependent formaldehyde-activating, GFA [Lentisphaera araneosa HTCC2155]|uniref:Glutathione-dependent formaldehyde-activating, GFA n=1 Tax=Lentisphaera araneosa HTCC2155 TaxID=313628 RepID=A6DIU2_9BACT|nr:GFA family protein [Lentisphaera araneosa]EDM28378.1 Glutathione-dependent formaldehyde-activating, GFA [Lentisphaera araneosa HTCC2155]